MPHQHPEDRVYTVISGIFYIGLGSVFDESGCRHIHREPSLCSPAVPRISTGRNLEPTSPKYRPSDRSASNTSTRSTIPGTSEQGLAAATSVGEPRAAFLRGGNWTAMSPPLGLLVVGNVDAISQSMYNCQTGTSMSS